MRKHWRRMKISLKKYNKPLFEDFFFKTIPIYKTTGSLIRFKIKTSRAIFDVLFPNCINFILTGVFCNESSKVELLIPSDWLPKVMFCGWRYFLNEVFPVHFSNVTAPERCSSRIRPFSKKQTFSHRSMIDSYAK